MVNVRHTKTDLSVGEARSLRSGYDTLVILSLMLLIRPLTTFRGPCAAQEWHFVGMDIFCPPPQRRIDLLAIPKKVQFRKVEGALSPDQVT